MTISALAALLSEQRAHGHASVRRLLAPAAMTVLAFAVGAALLGLAGWFIASAAVAGLAVASTYSFLFPSAGVQALAWARTLSRYGERITAHQATLDVAGTLRTGLFARALRLPRDRVAELRSGDLLGRITVDSDAVENLLLRSCFPGLAAVAALVGTAVLFTMLSAPVAGVAEAGLLLGGVTVIGLARRQARRPAHRLTLARAGARQALLEALDGLPELRSFGAEERAVVDITEHLQQLSRSRRTLSELTARGQGAGTLIADLTLLAVLAAAAGLLGTHPLTAPLLVAVCLVAIVAFEPVAGLPGAVTALAKARAAAARLAELFPEPAPAIVARGSAAHVWTVEIRLESQNVTLQLGASDTVVLTGASGTGKSTILRAIAGQRMPGVRVDLSGVPAPSIDPHQIADHVTLVAQDAYVFDGTIRDNLTLADPDADEPCLWNALRAAALDDTVRTFSAGLDTPVGPGGAWLSGGQRRRLSVARGCCGERTYFCLTNPQKDSTRTPLPACLQVCTLSTETPCW